MGRRSHLASPASLRLIDGLRGAAALVVLLAHAQWFLWLGESGRRLGIASGSHPSLLRLALYPFTFGRTAVLLFFVISGFCIHFRAAQRLVAQPRSGAASGSSFSFDVGDYAWRRLRRIMPPLVLAIGLTAVFDGIGARINPAFYARHTLYTGLNGLAVPRHDPGIALGNLLFMQGFTVPTFGTNDPLWSLAYEGFFYALYPGLLLLRRRWGVGRCTTSVGVGALLSYGGYVSMHWTPLTIGLYLVIWWLGAFVAEGYVRGRQGRGPRRILLLLVLTVSLIGLAAGIPFVYRAPELYNLMVGCAFAGLLAVGLLWPLTPRSHAVREWSARLFEPLGTVSYSLYLLHVPLISLLAAWWLHDHALLPATSGLLWTGVALSLALAWLAYLAVERPALRLSASRRPHPRVTAAVDSSNLR